MQVKSKSTKPELLEMARIKLGLPVDPAMVAAAAAAAAAKAAAAASASSAAAADAAGDAEPDA